MLYPTKRIQQQQMFYSQDYLGESVPEETFSYPLTPIMIISYPLSTSSIFCNPCYPLCL